MVQRAAKRMRREIGAIGLDENSIVRERCGDLARTAGVGKGERAREGYHISELDKLARHIDAARVAMKDASDVRELANHRYNVGVGISVVNANGETELLGECHLRAEVAMLALLVGVGIMIVKTYFAKADTLSALFFYHIFDFCDFCIHIREKAGIAWVNAEGEIHIVVFLCLLNSGAAGIRARADVNNCGYVT